MLPSNITPEFAKVRNQRAERTRTRSHVRNLLDLQDMLLSDARRDDISTRERAYTALAWERLEERLRILRNRPLPGNLRPASEPRKRTRRIAVDIARPEPEMPPSGETQ